MSTIFTKIVKREIPAHIVYEDDDVLAFLDIAQVTKGHTLVIPKNATPDIYNIDPELLLKVTLVAQKVAKAIQKAFNPPGINVIHNAGEAAGQTVYHFHYHIIPRYEHNEDFKITYRNNMDKLNQTEYEKRAHLIKEALL
ncbi:MAG: HIT family protein [Acholeplasmataceae bacterium]|jgi:histidine triad (HIT) family protein